MSARTAHDYARQAYNDTQHYLDFDQKLVILSAIHDLNEAEKYTYNAYVYYHPIEKPN